MTRASDARLAAALSEAGMPDLAKRAEAGEFNDYFGDSATPKMALVAEISSRDTNECDALVVRVMNGEFDSGRDEALEWYGTPEGQSMRGLINGL